MNESIASVDFCSRQDPDRDPPHRYTPNVGFLRCSVPERLDNSSLLPPLMGTSRISDNYMIGSGERHVGDTEQVDLLGLGFAS